jgi:Secretion system C-terminal sorting domain
LCGTTEIPIQLWLNNDQEEINKITSPKSIYKVYPNPSKDIVNIDLREENNLPEKGTTISGELFDMMGQSKSKVNIKDNKAVFSVLGLPRGIYVLKIYINDQIESHQIAVE